MELNKYMQIVSGRHAVVSLVEAALGLASEAGEVAQIIRKHEYESHGIKLEALRWNWATCCTIWRRHATIWTSVWKS